MTLKAYRKEYKRRFKAGRITDRQFYDWSERQPKKDKMSRGFSQELESWLKESNKNVY